MDVVEKINQLLNSMLSTLGDKLYSIIVMDRMRNVITQLDSVDMNNNLKSSVLSFLSSNMLSYFVNSDNKEHGTFSFQTNNLSAILSNAGDKAVVIFLTAIGESSTHFLPYVYLCAEKVARIMMGRNVSLMIPKFEDPNDIDILISEPHQFTVKEKGLYALKAILGGDTGVGKTTLVEQFIHNQLNGNFKSTLGINIMSKVIQYPQWNSKIDYAIFDLGGQAIYRQIRKNYYLGANVGFLVFDVTDRDSFTHINDWHDEVISAQPNTFLILIGNKVDLIEKRVVSTEEALELANRLNIQYLETCALNKDIVDEAFQTLGFSFIFSNNKLERKKVEIKSGWAF